MSDIDSAMAIHIEIKKPVYPLPNGKRGNWTLFPLTLRYEDAIMYSSMNNITLPVINHFPRTLEPPRNRIFWCPNPAHVCPCFSKIYALEIPVSVHECYV